MPLDVRRSLSDRQGAAKEREFPAWLRPAGGSSGNWFARPGVGGRKAWPPRKGRRKVTNQQGRKLSVSSRSNVPLEAWFKSKEQFAPLFSHALPGTSGLTIGEVARRVGMRTSALRYYERVGLGGSSPSRVLGSTPLCRQRWWTGCTSSCYAKQAGFRLGEIRDVARDQPAEMAGQGETRRRTAGGGLCRARSPNWNGRRTRH